MTTDSCMDGMVPVQLGPQASTEECPCFGFVVLRALVGKKRSPFVFDLCKVFPGTPASASVLLTLVRSESDHLIVQQFADMTMLIIRPPRSLFQSILFVFSANWLDCCIASHPMSAPGIYHRASCSRKRPLSSILQTWTV